MTLPGHESIAGITRTPPPVNIHIHDRLGDKDRARLLKILEKEKPVTVAKKPAPARPGWQTTEFWATLLVSVGGIAAAANSNLPPKYAAIASAVSVSAYAFSRALAKL